MNKLRKMAFVENFPTLKLNSLTRFSDVDEIKVRRLDEDILRKKWISQNPRDIYWDKARGDSYHEIECVYISFTEDGKHNFYWEVPQSILEKLIERRQYQITNLTAVVVESEGGFGIKTNQNEFGYGEKVVFTIYKVPKFEVSEFINNELKKEILKVKREADF